MQKHVQGITGRDRNTGKTVFKSWQSFEEEVSYIWNNARLYNEDQSLISQTAGILEKYFQKRLGEARRVVDEPPQPKVKLKMSAPPSTDQASKVTLKLGATKGAGTSGFAVDNEALKRQQQLVNASMTGEQPPFGFMRPFKPCMRVHRSQHCSLNHAQHPPQWAAIGYPRNEEATAPPRFQLILSTVLSEKMEPTTPPNQIQRPSTVMVKLPLKRIQAQIWEVLRHRDLRALPLERPLRHCDLSPTTSIPIAQCQLHRFMIQDGDSRRKVRFIIWLASYTKYADEN